VECWSALELTDEIIPGKSAAPHLSKRTQVRIQDEYSTNIARPYSQYCTVL
jgi:hypothetical protein